MNDAKQMFNDLSDDDLMLMLCVKPENLIDPSRWCRDMRDHIQASSKEPTTSQEADILFATAKRLREEANGELS
jgi:hypothetical protein